MNRIIITFLQIVFIITPLRNLISQWSISADLNSGAVNSIISNGNDMYAGTSGQGVFRSENSGLNWINVSSGLGSSTLVQSLAAEGDHIYAGTSSGGFFYSVNKGNDWIQSNQGISQQNIKTMITDGDTVYAGCIFAGVFRSVNNGLNWSRFALGEGDLLYALLKNESNFLIGLYGGIYRSTNNGVNWFISQSGITDNDIRCFVQQGKEIFCGTYGGGVFVTDNNGELWTSKSNGLQDLRIHALSSDGVNLFAGTAGKGIHYLNNTGAWIPVNEGINDSNITSIAFKDKYIFAASASGKIWKRLKSEIITKIASINSRTAADYRLYQNFPNPFNPVTSITFYIPEKINASLKVFDALGKEISVIFNGKIQEGKYTKFWNADNFPAGVYFCRLESESYSETIKLMLIK